MWRIVDGRLNLAAGPPAQTASRVAKDGLKKLNTNVQALKTDLKMDNMNRKKYLILRDEKDIERF